MKKNICILTVISLIAFTICTNQLFAQVRTGVNHKGPANTLDVNDDARVSTLNTRVMPNAGQLVITDAPINFDQNNTSGGVLYQSIVADAFFSSQLYVANTPHASTPAASTSWDNVVIGFKSSRLDFIGEASKAGSTIRFCFSVDVMHVNGSNAIYSELVPEFSVASTGTVNTFVSFPGSNANPKFTLKINGITFSCNITTGARTSQITLSNTDGYTVTGTVVSNFDYG